MTSVEIAGYVGKEHKNVVRDIRNMLVQLMDPADLARVIPEHYRNRHSEYIRENGDAILRALVGDGSDLSHLNRGFSWVRDNRGYVESFRLDKAHTMTLVSGYDVTRRHRIITRWLELEGGGVPAPKTYAKTSVSVQIKVERAGTALEFDVANTSMKELAVLANALLKG